MRGATDRLAASSPRRFLFLQGPLSPLYRLIGARLSAAGHSVRRINFCVGDWLHWHGAGSSSYRGRLDTWPMWIETLLSQEGVTDLVVHGDTRPYHREAVIAAERLGIAVHVTELGLVRPGFLTLERGGLGVLSRFPVAPGALARLSENAGEVDITPCYPASFALEAWQDVSYHLPNVALGWLFFPHHRRHTPLPPVFDYILWLPRLARAPLRRRRATALQETVLGWSEPFFVLPLQMEGDYQIVSQSPYASMRDALREVVASFAGHAPAGTRLVVKSHPLDNGWIDWRSALADLAREFALEERVVFLDGGDLRPLLARTSGVVTVNSTVGLDAMRAGVPVKSLVPAIYDGPGLTHEGDLDTFWSTPQPPAPLRVQAFVRALAAFTQVRGSIHNRRGLNAAVEGISARLLAPFDGVPDLVNEPPPRLERARALGVRL
ncbi:capsule biosynthesis protein [Stappia stellulata]|uniref:capsule biosynthesis protein n=1 Tax=Stappia stellulata TaxID=71235 RepID=UPI0003FF6E4D|nr:capsular biosynthesis protein [Stappia stellulata]